MKSVINSSPVIAQSLINHLMSVMAVPTEVLAVLWRKESIMQEMHKRFTNLLYQNLEPESISQKKKFKEWTTYFLRSLNRDNLFTTFMQIIKIPL